MNFEFSDVNATKVYVSASVTTWNHVNFGENPNIFYVGVMVI